MKRQPKYVARGVPTRTRRYFWLYEDGILRGIVLVGEISQDHLRRQGYELIEARPPK